MRVATNQILPTRAFIRRLLGCVALALVIIAAPLCIGVAGYHFIAGLPQIDALRLLCQLRPSFNSAALMTLTEKFFTRATGV